MSKNLAEIETPYQLRHIDVRTGQVLALLQNYVIADDQLLSTKQLATLCGVSEQWVEIGRQKDYGPKWVVIGPRCIRYRYCDVVAWLKERVAARAKHEAQKRRMRKTA